MLLERLACFYSWLGIFIAMCIRHDGFSWVGIQKGSDFWGVAGSILAAKLWRLSFGAAPESQTRLTASF
jgi:hypothetical protein